MKGPTFVSPFLRIQEKEKGGRKGREQDPRLLSRVCFFDPLGKERQKKPGKRTPG